MKKVSALCAAALALTLIMAPAAYAADAAPSPACYPTSVTRSEDGTEIRKVYDLSPEEDPAGIARSDFEQEGYHYMLLQETYPNHPDRAPEQTAFLKELFVPGSTK